MTEEVVLNARDAKLVDWLDEAHANEVRLESHLAGQLASIEKPTLKRHLHEHLEEIREHERLVATRYRQLSAGLGGSETPAVVSAVGEAAGRAMSALKEQITARASESGVQEAQVRLAQEQLREAHYEIALYTAIETFADAVGDDETAKLARGVLRDEERIAKFLADQLPKLVRDVVRAEIPTDQRR
jgi:ferritin-like metal-binding protein YciE